MLNKKALKASIPSPERTRKIKDLFNSSSELEVVFDFKLKNADGKRLLVTDMFFKDDLIIRNYLRVTKAKVETLNYNYKTNIWSETNITNLRIKDGYGYNWLVYKMLNHKYKQNFMLHKDVAIKYLGLPKGVRNNSIINCISSLQNSEREKRAEIKAKKLSAFMNKVPPLSKAQIKWLWSLYPKTGPVPSDKRIKYVNFLTKINGTLVLRHFKVRLYGRHKDIIFYEFARDIFVEGKWDKYEYTNYNEWRKGRSWEFSYYSKFLELSYLYTRNLKSVLKGTPFEYCGILEFEKLSQNEGTFPNLKGEEYYDRYLFAYLDYPQIEWLAKEGLSMPIRSIINAHTKITRMHEYNNRRAGNETFSLFDKDAKNTIGFLKLNDYYFKKFKSGESVCSETGLEIAHELIKRDIYLSDDDFYAICKLCTASSLSYWQKDKLFTVLNKVKFTAHKLIKYLKEQTEISLKNKGIEKAFYSEMSTQLDLYKDYLEFCKELGYDMRKKNVAFPRFLNLAHDNAAAEIVFQNNRELYEQYARFYSELASLDNIEIGDYIFKIPYDNDKFKVTGEALKICVGKGIYFKNMAKRNCLIFFIYKKDNLFTPHMVVEMKNGRVAQIYGYEHSTPDEKCKLAVTHYIRQINRLLMYKDDMIYVKGDEKPASKTNNTEKATTSAVA